MNTPKQTQRVWDLPTRLFHWALALLIALQYATGEFDLLDMHWHFWFGYATLALIAFRVLWGFCGSQTSRFGDFVRGPRAVLSYLRAQMSTNPQRSIGHNPLGGWSVLALLGSVAVQAVSGLFSSDDIDTDGPLVAHVSDRIVKLMTRVHHWNQNLLLVLIGLHIVAVLLYLLLKRDNLVAPMITGVKRVMRTRELRFANLWLAIALFALCAAAVALLVWCSG
ncbi:MAG: cytochrome b/b6 domain-containing protein [Rudaea sp.]